MSTHFTLASWNLYQGLKHSPPGKPRAQNLAVEQHLAELDADVLVLPETFQRLDPDATWAEDLAASLGYELHQWIGDRPSRTREIVRWRMVIMTRIPARRLEDHVFPQFANYGQRAAVRVELEESGLRLAGAHLYGIHLLPQQPRDFVRELASLSVLAADVDIVAGDMNIWSPFVRRSARPLRQKFRGRTYPAHRPHSQIDHLFAGENVDVISRERLPEMGSDHLGFKAKIARVAR